MVTILDYRKTKLCKGHRFSNAVEIMLYSFQMFKITLPIKLCKAAGSIHLFKVKSMLKAENIKLNKNFIWDMLEIDWKEVTVTINEDKIKLPSVITTKLEDKIKIR